MTSLLLGSTDPRSYVSYKNYKTAEVEGSALLTFDSFVDHLLANVQRACPLKEGDASHADKSNLGMWSPVALREPRRKGANVVSISCLVGDLDTGAETLEDVADALQGYNSLTFTTPSNTPEKPRFRTLVDLTRPVTAEEYPRFWAYCKNKFRLQVDEKCKDLSRIWSDPCQPLEGPFRHLRLRGAPLDVDACLAEAPSVEYAPVVAQSTSPLPPGTLDPCFLKAATIVGYGFAAQHASKPGDRHYAIGNAAACLVGSVPDNQIEPFLVQAAGVVAGFGALATELKLIQQSVQKRRDGLPVTGWKKMQDERPILYAAIKQAFPDIKVELEFMKETPQTVRNMLTEVSQGAADSTPFTDFSESVNAPQVAIKFNELTRLLCTNEWEGVFRFNVLTRRIEVRNPPTGLRLSRGLFSRGDVSKIRHWLGTILGGMTKDHKSATYKCDPSDIKDAVAGIAEADPFNPVVDWLDGLPKVEGTPHLDAAWDRILKSPDGPIASTLLKKHMVAAVRRARASDKGLEVDHQAVLVLCGAQNAGKTAFVKALGGEHYVSVVGELRNKDTTLKMQGAMFVDLEEMATANRADRDVLKAFLSRSADYERVAYAENAEKVPRSYVLWGSSNGLRLDDPTGLRRFWCVTVGDKIDWRYALEIRDLLWAEANSLAATDFDHHPTEEEQDIVAEKAKPMEVEDPLADRLRSLLVGVRFIRSAEAYSLAEGIDARQVMPHAETNRYAESFKRLGCTHERLTPPGGTQIRGWVIPEEVHLNATAQPHIVAALDKDSGAAAIRREIATG